jgi:predicted AlkP superfamily phosphohydrolase/phosphomutase/tetratricopeptide (TPR) repeat protein
MESNKTSGAPPTKVLLVGWDAADWKVIQPLMEAGKMPNVQRLVENGAMAQLTTLHPPLSPMLWTSIATGKRPFKHGIHGFSEPTADGRGVQPVTNLARKCKAVWNIFQQNGLRSIVVGWWPSHPAEPISGVMVSDHFHRASRPLEDGWPLWDGAVHPPKLAETLAELRMHPEELAPEMIKAFVPLAEKIDQSKDHRLLGCCKTLCECVSIHSAATWLLDHEPWDFFAVYYDAIDHFCHGFMKYHPPKQSWIRDEDFELYQGVVSMAYQFHDQMLGTLLRKAGSDVRVVLMSDHGFHPDHLRPRMIPHIPAGPAIEHSDFGILVMAGEGIKKDELIHGASVIDIAPTLLAMYGLPAGDDMDGKVLVGAFEEPPVLGTIPSWEDLPGDDGRHPPDKRLDPIAAKEALDQLVALGYIEAPGEDAGEAVNRTVRELRYNLCESYQDASMHADALEIARELYRSDPDEQRFAVKLFVSCQALGYVDEMEKIVEDLDGRRRALYVESIQRLIGFRKLAKQRFEERHAGTEQPAENAEEAILAELEEEPPVMPGEPPRPKREPLLTPEERAEVAKWRNLARLQPPVIDYLKAQVLTARHKWFDALECLGRVQEAHLARPGLLLQTADLYLRLRRFDEAEQTYVRALQIDPDNPHAHLGMSRMALRRRDYQAAAQFALNCLQRLYQYPMAHFLLGVALTGAGDYERAGQALRVALALNPNFPQAHARMAWLLKHRLGDPEAAAEHMRMYREIRLGAGKAGRAPTPDTGSAQRAPDAFDATPTQLPPLGDGVVVVSGLPRSGTSMIMQMLSAGGMPVLTDGQRSADDDNPLGYFEFEPVKQIFRNSEWIEQAAGKAVKVVAPLISALPERAGYRVILVERDHDEILASQAKMIERRGGMIEDTPGRRDRLREENTRLVERVKSVLSSYPDVHILVLPHAMVIRDPASAAHRINLFCGGALREEAMAASVRPELHRQKL